MRLIRALAVAAFVACLAAAALAKPPADEPKQGGPRLADPAAGKAKVERGSAEENEEFGRHQLPSEKGPKKENKVWSPPPFVPPPGTELTQSLSPGERPALRHLKKDREARKPKHQNKLENPRARNPRDFAVEYELDADAEVAVTIVGPQGRPVRQVTLPSGKEGGRKGKNKAVVWDGRDQNGRETRPGPYFLYQSIRYKNPPKGKAKKETRMIPLHGKEK